MERQKEMSRGARRAGGSAIALRMEAEATAALAQMGVRPTIDSHKYTWNTPLSTPVKAILTAQGFVQSTQVRPRPVSLGDG